MHACMHACMYVCMYAQYTGPASSKRQKLARAVPSAVGRPGPSTYNELSDWPMRHCSDMFDGEGGELRRMRATANMANGLGLASEYTGQMCAETGIRLQAFGMNKHGCDIPDSRVCCLSGNEINPTCRDVILNAKHRPSHLFGNVLHLLSDDHVRELKRLRPPSYGPNSVKLPRCERERRQAEAEAAYLKQYMYLLEHKEAGFTPGRRAYCLIHRRRCNVEHFLPSSMQREDRTSKFGVSTSDFFYIEMKINILFCFRFYA